MNAPAPDTSTGTPAAGGRPPSHRRRTATRRRALALPVAGLLALGLAALVGQELVTGATPAGDEPARPLSGSEASRLASMRQLNWEHGQAGVRATVGEDTAAVELRGWVDWRRPVIYLARSGPGGTGTEELIQAVPGLIAYRAGETAGTGPPPVDPPGDGWRLRQPGADDAAGAPFDPGVIDSLTMLLLTAGSTEAVSADLLAGSEARWLGEDRVAGHEVDILLGPALPPQVPPAGPAVPPRAPDLSLAAMGGAVRYWLDDEARLHRLEAQLASEASVRVDLDRTDRTAPPVLDALGGAAIDPRPVTDQEAGTLSRLGQRSQEVGGGEVALTLPDGAGGTVRASGWLDWRHQVAYLARYRAGAPDGLLWADRDGIASRRDHPPQRGLPPLPMPPPGGWQWSRWQERGDDEGGYDLDLLLNEALSLSGWRWDDPAALRETARWLRTDTLAGTAVTVYEIPRSIESRLDPGEARLRYWVADETGVLLRLELRTRSGGFGQLDLAPGPVPRLR